MSKRISAVVFTAAAILFAVSLTIFITSLRLINNFPTVSGSMRLSNGVLAVLTGTNLFNLLSSGMLAGFGFVVMALFGCLLAGGESVADCASTVTRY